MELLELYYARYSDELMSSDFLVLFLVRPTVITKKIGLNIHLFEWATVKFNRQFI